MKNKLTALLAALLLTLSLLPAQALAASAPEPADPPAVTDTGDPEAPDDPEPPAPLCRAKDDPPEIKDPGDGSVNH